MNNPPEFPVSTTIFSDICEAIADKGYIVVHNILPIQTLNTLRDELAKMELTEFKPAAIGRHADQAVIEEIRRDKILWIDHSNTFAQPYFDWSEQLRLAINRYLFLGLFDYETMFAYYAKGAFYKRHVDAFKGQSNRKLTSILYLNEAWQPSDGGELLMYQHGQSVPFQTVEPRFGTMVIFLSEMFPHEVTQSNCDRYSLTGWYRVNEGTPLA
ncbi:2OG-Fe(II) oxygenase [Shewanella colwelliana]|uniref:Proline hydroxylase n=1 Tax=Shewanella colwelliana TaxID=23 RepID=A0A1E5IPJ1_SHECO|nr:2OG-Fe(II) oxygenase [Shewanella colwelliana]MDX1280904.1 2OG-Fe(II) oxygenase [Shewanella colwelliana]OEG72415.1 proline hydroxylase [Shewanella colwelliana]GIU34434.1 prolyl 4-hydroxylase subunit alpha [Shewanella colwelliana]